MLKNSIAHVHKTPDAETFLPYQLDPIDLTIKVLNAVIEAEVTEVFPPALPLYDPGTGKWITKSPWAFSLALEAHQAETIHYYALVQIESVDTAEIRLMLDALLRVKEGRYYFSAPNEH